MTDDSYDPYDVVGASEAALILGVEVPRIWRWRSRGKMPPTVADPAATPVWHRIDIEALHAVVQGGDRLGTWDGDERPRIDVVGTADAAIIIGGPEFNKSQVGRWRRKGTFPEPVVEKLEHGETWTPGCHKIGATPLWRREDVEAFAATRQVSTNDHAAVRRAEKALEKAVTDRARDEQRLAASRAAVASARAAVREARSEAVKQEREAKTRKTAAVRAAKKKLDR